MDLSRARVWLTVDVSNVNQFIALWSAVQWSMQPENNNKCEGKNAVSFIWKKYNKKNTAILSHSPPYAKNINSSDRERKRTAKWEGFWHLLTLNIFVCLLLLSRKIDYVCLEKKFLFLISHEDRKLCKLTECEMHLDISHQLIIEAHSVFIAFDLSFAGFFFYFMIRVNQPCVNFFLEC